ncbi:MAG: hypothetical protein ACFFC0_04275, partial [Promethearchaeota archaeon]
SQDKWTKEGAKDSVSLAREQVAKMLAVQRVEPMSEDCAAKLDSTFRSILQKHEVPESSLPSLS